MRAGSPAVPGGQWQRARCCAASQSAPVPHAPAHADTQRCDTHASAPPHCESDVHSTPDIPVRHKTAFNY